MYREFQIVYQDKPEWETVGGGIHNYNALQVDESNEQNLCFVLQGPDQEIIGGVIGTIYWDWFYINLMWIKEAFRRRGYGDRLLKTAVD